MNIRWGERSEADYAVRSSLTANPVGLTSFDPPYDYYDFTRAAAKPRRGASRLRFQPAFRFGAISSETSERSGDDAGHEPQPLPQPVLPPLRNSRQALRSTIAAARATIRNVTASCMGGEG